MSSDQDAYQIGSARFSLFPLSETHGVLEGLIRKDGWHRIPFTDLGKFSLLEEGHVTPLPDPAAIEIVSFSEYRVQDELAAPRFRANRFTLAGGARLTGPLLWRDLELDPGEIVVPAPSDPVKQPVILTHILPALIQILLICWLISFLSFQITLAIAIGLALITAGLIYLGHHLQRLEAEARRPVTRIEATAPSRVYWSLSDTR